jgi:hypothetical protein
MEKEEDEEIIAIGDPGLRLLLPLYIASWCTSEEETDSRRNGLKAVTRAQI